MSDYLEASDGYDQEGPIPYLRNIETPVDEPSRETVAIVACAKMKQNRPAPAAALYTSPLFKLSREYAKLVADRYVIVSAKYGIVAPSEILHPYDVTLSKMTKLERLDFQRMMSRHLRRHIFHGSRIIILAGERYLAAMHAVLVDLGCTIEEPLSGMQVGQRLQFLKAQLSQRSNAV